MQKRLHDPSTVSFQHYIQQQFDLAAEQLCDSIQQQPDLIQYVADVYAHWAWQALPAACRISVSGLDDDGAAQFCARAEYQTQCLSLDVAIDVIDIVWKNRFGVQHRVYLPINNS